MPGAQEYPYIYLIHKCLKYKSNILKLVYNICSLEQEQAMS